MDIALVRGNIMNQSTPGILTHRFRYHKIYERVISLVFLSIRQLCHTLCTKKHHIVITISNVFSISIIPITQLCWFYVILLSFITVFLLIVSIFSIYCSSSNIMLRVSFSLGRDRACRHCWISSFWTPLGKRALFLKNGPLIQFHIRRRTTTVDDGRRTTDGRLRRR